MSMFDVSPPAWLVDQARVNREQGQWGQFLGTGLGALTRMLTEKNPVYDDRGQPVVDESGKQKTEAPSFGTAFGEARMSQANPLWKLKAQEAQTSVWNNVAALEAAHQKLKMTADESRLYTEDLSGINKYVQDLKTDLNAIPPAMKSMRGMQQVEQLSQRASQAAYQKDKLEQQKQSSKIELDRRDRGLEWQRDLVKIAGKFPDIKAQIDKLPNGGFLPNGDISGEAISKMNTALNQMGEPGFGDKEGAKQAARATGQSIGEKAISAYEASKKRGDPPDVQARYKAYADKVSGGGEKDTATIRSVNQIFAWEQDAKDAEAAGDMETAKALKEKADMVRTQMKGQGVSFGYDSEGRPQFWMGKGEIPTVGTQTTAQEKALQYQNAIELLTSIESQMKPEHVGIAGKVGEIVVDKTLEQFIPGVASGDRIDVRTAMKAAAGVARQIIDDHSGRFTAEERREVAEALPDTGMIESYADSMRKLERVKKVLRSYGTTYSSALGKMNPAFMTPEEIKQKYQAGKNSKLDPSSPAFKSQFLTQEEAAKALQRYYPNQFGTQ